MVASMRGHDATLKRGGGGFGKRMLRS